MVDILHGDVRVESRFDGLLVPICTLPRHGATTVQACKLGPVDPQSRADVR